jgi:hypothetical protein
MSDSIAAPSAPAAASSAPSTPAATPAPSEAAASSTSTPSTPAAPVAPSKRQYKLKVDGQEVVEELSDDEIPLRLQKAKAADKRFQEAADLQKKLQEAMERFIADPFEASEDPVFKERGLNMWELAEKKLAEKYRAEMLKAQDPKEFERVEREQALTKREQEIQKWQQEQKAQQQQAVEQHVAQETFNTFNSAIEKHGLPRDGETLAMMADIALLNLDHGIELTVDQLAQATKERLDGFSKKAKSQFETMDGDALINELGPAVVEKVRNALLAKARAQRGQPKPQAPTASAPEPEERPYRSESEVRRRLLWGP